MIADPLVLSEPELLRWVNQFVWVFARVGALFLAAPVLRSTGFPPRVRVLVALFVTLIVLPSVPAVPTVDPLSAEALMIGVREVAIGLAMGFVLQMVFAALTIAGESISMSMGLGFSTMIDPQNGVPVPVLSQYFVLLATLIFLSLDGHLLLFQLLAASFQTLPIAPASADADAAWQLVGWASEMYAGALLIALPVLTAVLMANLAFAVVTRAAPQLNIFAVGFPFMLLLGFASLLVALGGQFDVLESLFADAFHRVRWLIGVGV